MRKEGLVKKVGGLGAIALLGSILVWGHQPKREYSAVSTYQGVNKVEGEAMIFFDEKTLTQRTNVDSQHGDSVTPPKYGFTNYPKNVHFEMGENYTLTIVEPNFEWLYGKRLKDATSAN